MKISACWIVKNEETELAASMQSVKDCAEELIVLDTGSTDGTVRIAIENGARVEHFTWVNDFSAARNFCLTFAKGDYIIFLDADEYFSPPLSRLDGAIIAEIFIKTKADTLQLNRIEIDADTGKIIGSEPHARFMKLSSVYYENTIHEIMTRKDGTKPDAFFLEGYRIMHTGYSAKRIAEKYRRNIEYLEAQKTKTSDAFALFHNHAYLMREYFASKDFDKAFENCRYLFEHYELWESVCKTFSHHYIQRFYIAINLANVKRFSCSRKEIYKKLVKPLKEVYAGFREAMFIDLYYQIIFDYRGGDFLKNLKRAEELGGNLPPLDIMESKNAEAAVFGRGALAAYYRKDYDRAKHLARHALQIMPDTNTNAMTALIEGSFSTNTMVSNSMLCGDYIAAYDCIIAGLEQNPLDYNLLEFLDIVAEKGEGALAMTARELYEEKRALLDEAIDLSDFVNTGYVEDEELAENKEGLKNITFETLKKIIEWYKNRPTTDDILTLHSLAAEIYEKKSLPVSAMRSHLLLYAKNKDVQKHLAELARLFHENENETLAEKIFASRRSGEL